MSSIEGLVQRKNLNRDPLEGTVKDVDDKEEGEDDLGNGIHLTLMEEVFLLGLNGNRGYTFFWNDCISRGLRGCILVELALRGRLELEHCGMRQKNLLSRKLLLKNDTPTGELFLDEVLKHISNCENTETIDTWLEYLSGESWNPLKMRYQLRNVRERLGKNLVEKGVLIAEKNDYFFFDMTTYFLNDNDIKSKLVKKIQDSLLIHWTNDPHRMQKRILCLIILSHASDVLENAFTSLNNEDYYLALKRARDLLGLNFEEESCKSRLSEVIWAVFACYTR